jgi:hypothetical protein
VSECVSVCRVFLFKTPCLGACLAVCVSEVTLHMYKSTLTFAYSYTHSHITHTLTQPTNAPTHANARHHHHTYTPILTQTHTHTHTHSLTHSHMQLAPNAKSRGEFEIVLADRLENMVRQAIDSAGFRPWNSQKLNNSQYKKLTPVGTSVLCGSEFHLSPCCKHF